MMIPLCAILFVPFSSDNTKSLFKSIKLNNQLDQLNYLNIGFALALIHLIVRLNPDFNC